MNDLGSDFSKSYLIYIEECLGTFYSKHPSGPHLPLCLGGSRGASDPLPFMYARVYKLIHQPMKSLKKEES